MSAVIGNTRSRKAQDPARLTERQREILNLSLAGTTAEQIADELGLSVFTVKNHIALATEKLRCAGIVATRVGGIVKGTIGGAE
jgi:DNA-binding CsgD family transcriptional regulator